MQLGMMQCWNQTSGGQFATMLIVEGVGGALFFSPIALASDILFNTPAFCVQIWFDLRCEQVLFVHVLQ